MRKSLKELSSPYLATRVRSRGKPNDAEYLTCAMITDKISKLQGVIVTIGGGCDRRQD